MSTEKTTRPTATLAVGTIVATLALLVTGFVVAPTGGEPDSHGEAAVLAGSSTPAEHPHDVASDDDHAHAGEVEVAAAPGTTPTTAHGHGDTDATQAHHSAAIEISTNGSVEPADAHGHDDHDVAVANPSSPAAPAAPAADGHGDHHATPDTTAPAAPTTATTVAETPIISIDDARLTDAQRGAAQDLFDRTTAAMAAFPNEAAVVAAGYESIGDGGTGFEHFVKVDHLTDGFELDADHIESIVLKVGGGTKTVASAMYILTTGSTMADVPEIAGELTTWHDHQNLCWEGIRVVGIRRGDGTCPRGEFRPTAPMLHVWLTAQPCGPFSGIEGTHGGGCASHGH